MSALPKHVYAVKDRHGKTRYRFTKAGLLSDYLPVPSDPGFQAAYADCFNPDRQPKRPPCRKPAPSWRNPFASLKGRSLVYFIATKGGLVKIGTTINLAARLKKLQTGAPSKLNLLTFIEGDAATEAELHIRFSDLRVRGEWFRHTGPLREEIRRLKAAKFPTAKFPTIRAD